MTDWQPASQPETAAERARLLGRARSYFDSQNVLEVETPALVAAPPTDPTIESMALENSQQYLHTSPEFHMKRLLAAGYPDIFSICRVFRGNERGRYHLPEFTMIEWYRHAFGLAEIIDDSLQLIAHIAGRDAWASQAEIVEYRACFENRLNLDPLSATIEAFAAAANADAELQTSIGDDRDTWLDLLMSTRIAPSFDPTRITVVRHYPASQAALARVCPGNSELADRFEIYCGPIELANGYVELTNAEEQERRMLQDLEVREARRLPVTPRDDALLAALESGLPDCAGVALGFERLHMLLAGSDSIEKIVSFT